MEAARLALAALRRGEGSVEAVLRDICRDVSDHLAVTRTSIWRFNEIGDRIVNLVDYDLRTGAFTSGDTCDEEEYPAYFRAIKDEFRVVAHDTRYHPATAAMEEGALAHRDVCSLLDVLVTVGSQPVAILCAEHCGSFRTWTDEDVVYVGRMGALLRMALRHAIAQPA